jgi:energy-converting hydrogenase Eha subunit A
MSNASMVYIAISLIALVAIVILLFITRKKQKHYSKLTMFGTGLIVLGIVFGSERVVGYTLIGGGVLFAVIDLIRGYRRK